MRNKSFFTILLVLTVIFGMSISQPALAMHKKHKNKKERKELRKAIVTGLLIPEKFATNSNETVVTTKGLSPKNQLKKEKNKQEKKEKKNKKNKYQEYQEETEPYEQECTQYEQDATEEQEYNEY